MNKLIYVFLKRSKAFEKPLNNLLPSKSGRMANKLLIIHQTVLCQIKRSEHSCFCLSNFPIENDVSKLPINWSGDEQSTGDVTITYGSNTDDSNRLPTRVEITFADFWFISFLLTLFVHNNFIEINFPTEFIMILYFSYNIDF